MVIKIYLDKWKMLIVISIIKKKQNLFTSKIKNPPLFFKNPPLFEFFEQKHATFLQITATFQKSATLEIF
jgi:hypothetical protein